MFGLKLLICPLTGAITGRTATDLAQMTVIGPDSQPQVSETIVEEEQGEIATLWFTTSWPVLVDFSTDEAKLFVFL